MAGGGNITLKNSRIGIVYLLIFLIGTNHLSSALTKKRELLFFFDKIEINGAVDVFVKPALEMPRRSYMPTLQSWKKLG